MGTAVRTEPAVRTAAPTAYLTRSPSAVALAVAAMGAALAALVVTTAGDGWAHGPAREVVVDLAVGLTYPAIGAVVLLAEGLGRGTRQLAWVLLGAGTAAALSSLAAAVVLVTPATSGVVTVLAQLQSWLWVPGFVPLVTLVPLLYPDGLPAGRLWRWVAVASLVGTALLAAGVGLYPEAVEGRVSVDKPVTSLTAARTLYVAGSALLVPAALLAVASLLLRLRRTSGLRRRQLVVLLIAAGVLLAVTAAQGLVPAPANTLAQALAVALVPVAIGVAVTRHRLYELDVAVSRALVATILAVCLAGTYLTVFALARAVAPGSSALGTAVAAAVTGVLVQPLARRLSAGVERLFYGDRADPYAVSARLASRLAEQGLDVAEVPQAVCDTVVEALRLESASIHLAGSDQAVGAATLGRSETHAPATLASARFPLRHRGTEVGTLTVTARQGEAALDLRDAEVVATLADQAAPAIAALQLHRQLQHSRESLVLAREEERLRLRRDLHDGLGATLAGLRLQVESAQALVHEPGVASLLSAAGRGVTSAVEEVRGITDGLRPPALDELGLAAALELVAERVSTADLHVRVDVQTVHLGAAVEVAAYRIASEGLANVARHSGATEATLSLAIESDSGSRAPALVLEIGDNGRGLPPSGHASTSGSGLGLAAMRQRAEELGGSFEITSPADRGVSGRTATLVRAVLPLLDHDHPEEAP